VLPPAPPTVNAEHFAMILSVNEFLVSMGTSRVGMTMNAGQPMPVQMIEWFQTLSVSPQAARQLMIMLEDAVKTYEADFGSLPRDKAATVSVSKNEPPK
jgi:hypothetical protein